MLEPTRLREYGNGDESFIKEQFQNELINIKLYLLILLLNVALWKLDIYMCSSSCNFYHDINRHAIILFLHGNSLIHLHASLFLK